MDPSARLRLDNTQPKLPDSYVTANGREFYVPRDRAERRELACAMLSTLVEERFIHGFAVHDTFEDEQRYRRDPLQPFKRPPGVGRIDPHADRP